MSVTKKVKKRVRIKGKYWGDAQEQAVRDYQDAATPEERNIIYENHLRHPLDQMIEAIMFRWTGPGSDMQTTKQSQIEALEHILEKFHKFSRDRIGKNGTKTKAYSFFGTVIRHYLMGQKKKNVVSRNRLVSLDDENSNAVDENMFGYEDKYKHLDEGLVLDDMCLTIQNHYGKLDDSKKSEILVGKALVEIINELKGNLTADFNYKTINKQVILKLVKSKSSLTNKEITKQIQNYYVIYSKSQQE